MTDDVTVELQEEPVSTGFSSLVVSTLVTIWLSTPVTNFSPGSVPLTILKTETPQNNQYQYLTTNN